jgi:hypothetical protein
MFKFFVTKKNEILSFHCLIGFYLSSLSLAWYPSGDVDDVGILRVLLVVAVPVPI